MASDPFEIVVGTYEQYLLGYKVNNIVNEYKMEKSFATHSHVGSIRSVASNKHYLASSGADDSVYLYDLHRRAESGRLMHHNDTVNCITFTPEASHLFTCSNDGTMAAIRCGNWQMEKHWLKPHKGLAVNTMAIHPTGKIALSTGADGILRTWNLVKGRQAYATNLVPRLKLDAKSVNVLKWSPNGEKYLLAVNQRIDVYSVELAGVDSEIKFDSKIVCVEFLKDDLIAVGLENGQIKFYDLEKSIETVDTIAHDIRVKCMAFKGDLLVTASSSGEIKLWRYSRHKLDMLQKVNCGARITCLSLAMLYDSIAKDTEVKVEEEKQQKTKKFRLRQEVIVEKEGDWEVSSISSRKSEKKSKKKRNIEVEDVAEIPSGKRNKSILKKKTADSIDEVKPKKKKKEDNKNKNESEKDVSNTKKKKRLIALEENNNVPVKKLKKLNVQTTEQIKSPEISTGNDKMVSQKKRKLDATEDRAFLKKKKKKQ